MSRPPEVRDRSELSPNEWGDYDYIIGQYSPLMPDGDVVHDAATPYPYYKALLAAPPAAAALSRVGRRLHDRFGAPGAYTPGEHELIDIVLSFELGYWGLLAFHVPGAVAEGVRVDAIAALRDGREGELTPDERQQVEFIRAVIAGEVTDEQWNAMEERFGDDRTVLEYSMHILLLQMHVRLHQVLGMPAISEEAFDELLTELKSGARALPAPEKGVPVTRAGS
jgi:hypothetical protein